MNKKLNKEAVLMIRKTVEERNRVRRELSNKQIARKLNVSVGAIRNVIKGARWGHVK